VHLGASPRLNGMRVQTRPARARVKQQHGLASVAALYAGVFTVVQRFRSDLGLYVRDKLADSGSLGRAKSSGSCGGGGAAGLGMTRSRRRWWLANTP
jgi:hypothetical protein